jgi:hypothetical protein
MAVSSDGSFIAAGHSFGAGEVWELRDWRKKGRNNRASRILSRRWPSIGGGWPGSL